MGFLGYKKKPTVNTFYNYNIAKMYVLICPLVSTVSEADKTDFKANNNETLQNFK